MASKAVSSKVFSISIFFVECYFSIFPNEASFDFFSSFRIFFHNFLSLVSLFSLFSKEFF